MKPRPLGSCSPYHPVIFILTFMSYAFFHATRKTFSNVKTTISEEWSPSFHNDTVNETRPNSIWNTHHLFDSAADAELYLGVLDAVFLGSYAVGLYISGIIGDRFNMRYVLTFGMCSSAIVVFVFGTVLEWFHYYNKYLYVALWVLNGLFQSTGWPTVVAIMGNWFGKSSRGFVLGLWSACASVGNIIGALLSAAVLDYGYEYTFLLTSSVLFAGGVINFFGLVTSPRELGFAVADEGEPSSKDADITVTVDEADKALREPLLASSRSGSVQANERPDALGFFQALCLPGVILYSLSYACLKFVNYSFFFWLPYYLGGAFGWPETAADEISVWYDVGGIIGGTIFGFVSDRFSRRTIVLIPMLILAIPSLFIYGNSPNNRVANAVLMAVVGFFIGGVANLVSAAVAADLGKQGPVQGNTEALATVTGIVDGTGSVGAAIGQILVPVVQKALGWHSVFYLFMVMTLLTAICILPLFIREVRDMCRNYRFSWYGGIRKQTIDSVNEEEPTIQSDEE